MNTPVKALAFFAFVICCLNSCGDKGSTVAPTPVEGDKTISLKIENGTGLTYKISPAEAVSYSLDLTFHELSPKINFDYVITNIDYTKGEVEIDENARKTSHQYTTSFQNGKNVFTDKTSMVLSLEIYRDLLETGKATILWDNESLLFKTVNNEEYKFEKGNGQVTETVMYCATDDKAHEFWVWKNAELPLIMKIGGKTKLELSYWYLPGERP